MLTVAVNHLKSKGSSCASIGDPDTGDGQGNCNLTRTKAAQALVDWLATDPTGSGDPDFLIIGDLNAYAMEDPITAIKAAGYTDLIEALRRGRRPTRTSLRASSATWTTPWRMPAWHSQVTGVDRVAHQRRRAACAGLQRLQPAGAVQPGCVPVVGPRSGDCGVEVGGVGGTDSATIRSFLTLSRNAHWTYDRGMVVG